MIEPMPSFACNFNQSLLVLAQKLCQAEIKILGKQTHKVLNVEKQSSVIASCISEDGFHFSTSKYKRSLEDLPVESHDFPSKRFCSDDTHSLQSKNHLVDKLKSNTVCNLNEEDSIALNRKINEPDIEIEQDTLSDSLSDPKEGRISVENAENFEHLVKTLKNLVLWKSKHGANLCDANSTDSPSLWAILSSTKFGTDPEQCRIVDAYQNSIKDEIPYWNRQFKKKDVRRLLKKAIDVVVSSRMQELESIVTVAVKKDVVKLLRAENLVPLEQGMDSNCRRFECTQCSYKTDNRSHMMRHQSTVHNAFKPYCCYVCSKEFARVEHAKQHFGSAHPGILYNPTLVKKDRLSSNDTLHPYATTFENSAKHNGFVDKQAVDKQAGDKQAGDKQAGDKAVEKSSSSKCDSINGIARKHNENGERFSSKVNGASSREFFAPVSDKQEKVDGDKLNGIAVSSMKILPTGDEESSSLLPAPNKISDDKNAPSKTNDFVCFRCKKNFTDRQQLEVHSATAHMLPLFCCANCSYYTWNKFEFDFHTRNEHREILRLSLGKSQACVICRESFSEDQELEAHMQQKHERHSFGVPSVPPLKLLNDSPVKEKEINEEEESNDASESKKSDGSGQRRTLNTYFCPYCKDRPPFRYRKSFNKHMLQHGLKTN